MLGAGPVATLAADAGRHGIEEDVPRSGEPSREVAVARDARGVERLGEPEVGAVGGPGIDVPARELRVVVDGHLVEALALPEVERHSVAARAEGVRELLRARLGADAIGRAQGFLDEVAVALAVGSVRKAAARMATGVALPASKIAASHFASREASGRSPVRAIEWRA